MAKAEIFLADDSNSKVESGSIDITRMPLFKLGVSLRATEGRSYEGYVYMFGEDTQTHETIQIPGIEDNVSVHSSFDVPLFSYWLRQSNQPFADGHTYRIYVTGKTDGNDVELTSPKAPAYYLKREGSIFSIYSGTATAIDDAPTTAPTVSLSAGQLAVSAEGAQSHTALQREWHDGRPGTSHRRPPRRALPPGSRPGRLPPADRGWNAHHHLPVHAPHSRPSAIATATAVHRHRHHGATIAIPPAQRQAAGMAFLRRRHQPPKHRHPLRLAPHAVESARGHHRHHLNHHGQLVPYVTSPRIISHEPTFQKARAHVSYVTSQP